jgi:ASC-1-like (ASCH) protein
LEKLPASFDGVDDQWVDSLFAGYDRKDSQDINKKFKIIYVAVDQLGEVVGVVGATPKKGEPIKNMPLVAKNLQAFIALLIDAPYLLKEYGHKIYTHINPTASEIIALQRFGWKLNTLMPEAYKKEIVTQQWSFDFKDDCIRALRVKSDFLKSVKTKEKTLEVRVLYPTIEKIKEGDHIKLFDYDESLLAEVSDRRVYTTFAEMLNHEDSSKIAPGYDKEKLLNLLGNFYPPEKENLGVVVFEIFPLLN